MTQPQFTDDTFDDLLEAGADRDDEYESIQEMMGDDTPPEQTRNTANDPGLSQYLQEDLRQRREELQQRQWQAQQAQQVEAQRRFEEQRAQRQRDLDARLDQVFRAPEAPQLTPEERDMYTASLPVIQRYAEYHSQQAVAGLRDTVREVMAGRMELEDELAALRQAQQANPRAQLDATVRAQVPDIDNMLASPQWKEFCNKQIPHLGVTPGEVIGAHYQNGNAQGVVSVVNMFKNRSKTSRTETPAPAQRAASAPVVQGGGRGRLRYSELDAAYNKAEQGLLARDKLAQIVEKYETAAAEGRVDYNR